MPNCCTQCFSERLIQQFIEAAKVISDCDYCGSSNVPIRVVDEVGAFVREGVLRYYEDAANSVHYETAEGGYTMDTATITEILLWELDVFDSPHFDPGDLADDLADDDATGYVRRDPYGPPSGHPEEIDHWDKFCEVVTNSQRFTAFLRTGDSTHDDGHPALLMGRLADLLNNAFLVTELSAGTKIYRSRLMLGDERFCHEELTSPPPEKTRNNRMSPAGISFFYGCLDIDTCVAEVRPSVGDRIGVGEFEVLRSLRVLDLSQPIEESISIFSEDYSFTYEEYLKPFLRHFVADIAKPIRPFESDILYVPTQAFTEFMRVHEFCNPIFSDPFGEGVSVEGEPPFHVDGIRYKSSLRSGGTNIVLFRGPDISTTRATHAEQAWLQYHGYSIYELQGISYTSKRLKRRLRRSR